jgi:diguanylate cyclase (GGDEF)-like protein
LGLEATSLFCALAIILIVMAAAFHLAGRHEPHERYWRSWRLANLLIGVAIFAFIFEPLFPNFVIATVPNGLLVLGFGLRWKAAREFAGRAAPISIVCGPALVFVALCTLPAIGGAYGNVFTTVNALLAGLATAVAIEFWRDRADRLPSRYGLIAAYAIIALSFAIRVGQGVFEGLHFENRLPQDGFLVFHLLVAVIHVAGSGAFALSLAYERSAARLRHAATHDSLTGLMNRGAFEAAARQRLANRDGRFAIALIDIDHFKRINDLHGHAAGDAALRACAAICRRELRAHDTIARVGGEEFAVILEDVSARDAAAVVERLRQAVASTPIELDGSQIELTVSAGLCHPGDGAETLDAVMRAVDDKLYEAKRGGRNRIAQASAA